jgi:hypothetical protein
VQGSPASPPSWDLAVPPPGLPPLPPPARPKAPRSPPTTRPQPTLQAAVNLGRAPRRPCGLSGGAGRQSWARGRVLVFRKIIYYVFSAKSTHEKSAYPTPTLEEAADGEGQEARHTGRPEERRRRRNKREEEKKIKQKKEKKEKKSKRRNTYPRAGQARPKARPALLLTQEEPAVHPPTPSLPWEVRNIGEIEAKDGLPSADRNNKATLLLTGPFRTAKSSAKDLTPLVLKLQYANYRGPLRGPRRNRLLRH